MKCKKTTINGKKCGANALVGNAFCFSHSPTTSREHKIATSKGGRATLKKNCKHLTPLDLSTPESVLELISDTINRVRMSNDNGYIDVKTGNCIAILANRLIEAQKFTKDEKQKKEREDEEEITDEELFGHISKVREDIKKEKKGVVN